MNKLVLIVICALTWEGVLGQTKTLAAFRRPVLGNLHPRRDLVFYNEKAVLMDSTTGKKSTINTFYYFHKATQSLRLVSVYRIEEGVKFPIVNDYVFTNDSLQKIGIFPHSKLCKGCYGVYTFSEGQLTSKEERGIPAEDTWRLLMNALEYQLKAALFFKEPTK